MRKRLQPWRIVAVCGVAGLLLAVTVLSGAAQGLVGIAGVFAVLFAIVRGLDSPDVQSHERQIARDEVGSGHITPAWGRSCTSPHLSAPSTRPTRTASTRSNARGGPRRQRTSRRRTPNPLGGWLRGSRARTLSWRGALSARSLPLRLLAAVLVLPHMGWGCQGRRVCASGSCGRRGAGVVWRVGRRGVRVGATLGQPHMRDRCGLRTLVRRSVRCLQSSGRSEAGTRYPGRVRQRGQPEGETFI